MIIKRGEWKNHYFLSAIKDGKSLNFKSFNFIPFNEIINVPGLNNCIVFDGGLFFNKETSCFKSMSMRDFNNLKSISVNFEYVSSKIYKFIIITNLIENETRGQTILI